MGWRRSSMLQDHAAEPRCSGGAVAIEPIVVKNLGDVVMKVLKLQSDGGNDCRLWFRGQRCHEHSLISKLQRTATSPEAVFDRERRLLIRFRQRSLPFWPAGYPQDQW